MDFRVSEIAPDCPESNWRGHTLGTPKDWSRVEQLGKRALSSGQMTNAKHQAQRDGWCADGVVCGCAGSVPVVPVKENEA